MNAKELVAPLSFLLVVGCMIVPLPPALLDILLVTNLLAALLLVIGGLQIKDPLKVAALPSLLLLATLFRLSLNLATTRAVLSTGHAGQAVEAFGSIVIQGSPVVGFVLFILITLVQFIVVAKGAERVAEVAARFTLDALPGKQMAIDAEIRSGLLDPEAARKKRAEVGIESRFYGALDGAMKFVKGDSIAGLVITAVNIVGGLLIGIVVYDLDLSVALRKYTVLTIGDGLLSQIPSLLNSVAAGLVVTRVQVDESSSLSSDLLSQVAQFKTARLFVAGAALVLGIIPGMPHFALLGISALLVISLLVSAAPDRPEAGDSIKVFEPGVSPVLQVEVDRAHTSTLPAIVTIAAGLEEFRTHAFDRWGLVLPRPSITARDDIGASFRILVRGIEVYRRADVPEDVWVAVQERLRSVLDVFRLELVDDAMTRKALDYVEKNAPDLVGNVVPQILTLTQMTGVLRGLLKEEITIRHLDVVLQAVAESGGRLTERMLLSEVRVALRHVISRMAGPNGRIRAIVLDPVADLLLARAEEEGSLISTELIEEIGSQVETATAVSVAISSKRARPYLRDLLRAKGVMVPVIAHEEVAPGYWVEPVKVTEIREGEGRLELLERLAA